MFVADSTTGGETIFLKALLLMVVKLYSLEEYDDKSDDIKAYSKSHTGVIKEEEEEEEEEEEKEKEEKEEEEEEEKEVMMILLCQLRKICYS
jgi:deoxycytidine triphosphate deaminase